ncbi:hypothetical protein D3C85_991780 [compost metagenome]
MFHAVADIGPQDRVARDEQLVRAAPQRVADRELLLPRHGRGRFILACSSSSHSKRLLPLTTRGMNLNHRRPISRFLVIGKSLIHPQLLLCLTIPLRQQIQQHTRHFSTYLYAVPLQVLLHEALQRGTCLIRLFQSHAAHMLEQVCTQTRHTGTNE